MGASFFSRFGIKAGKSSHAAIQKASNAFGKMMGSGASLERRAQWFYGTGQVYGTGQANRAPSQKQQPPIEAPAAPGKTLNLTNTPDPEDLVVNTSTENRPVPVPFGTVRLGGNFIRYDNATFRNVPITKTTTVPGTPPASGNPIEVGKGGGSAQSQINGQLQRHFAILDKLGIGKTPKPIVPPASSPSPPAPAPVPPPDIVYTTIAGYTYYLTFDMAICIGPIDSMVNVRTVPGNQTIVADQPMTFETDGSRTVTADDGDGFGGKLFLYNGATAQVRRSDDAYNDGIAHRNVCLAHFKDFSLGTNPSPKTLLWEVLRLPRVYDAAGATLADFPTRGSTNVAHPCYTDANPAAALWEILTNANWGAAIPHAMLDVASFRTAAQFYAASDIGVSFSLTSEDFLDEIIRFISGSVSGLLVWNGSRLRFTCLMDTATAHATRIRLTEDQVLDPAMNRGSWASAFNELRMTFTNRERGHNPEIVHVQDLASINALGRIQATQIEVPAFSNRTVAEIQARRLLNEIAYPKGSITFSMTRYAAGMEPGALIEFVWSSWGVPTTTYWRVVSLSDSQTSGGTIRVSANEDLLAVPFRGVDDVFSDPALPHLIGEIRTPEEIELGDDATETVIGAFGPGVFYEVPGVMTGGKPYAVLGIQRRDGATAFTAMTWEIEGSGASNSLPQASPWAQLGALQATVPVSNHHARSLIIDVLLDYPNAMTEILSAASFVSAVADDFSTLAGGPYNLLFVGSEIMRVGWATDQGGGVVRFSAILRGEFGTTIQSHASATRIMFLPRLQDANQFNLASIPQGENIEFEAEQVLTRGIFVDGAEVSFFGPQTKKFDFRSLRPPPPQIYGTPTKVGADWTFELRPTFTARGAATHPTLSDDLADLITTIPSSHGLRIEGRTGAGALVTNTTATIGERFETLPSWMPAGLAMDIYRFIPDTGDSDSCILHCEATPHATVAELRIWTTIDGAESATYLSIIP